MTLLSTVRAFDDARFKWRVKGALIQLAVQKIDDADAGVAAYARSVMLNPLGDATMATAIVAANPAISSNITVDEFNTVSTEGVPDSDIVYVIDQNWDELVDEFVNANAPAEPTP